MPPPLPPREQWEGKSAAPSHLLKLRATPNLPSESFTSKSTACLSLLRRRSWSDRWATVGQCEERDGTEKGPEAQQLMCCIVCVQFEKQPLQTHVTDSRAPFTRKHWRSRSLGGIIKVILFTLKADCGVSSSLYHEFSCRCWCNWTVFCLVFLIYDK